MNGLNDEIIAYESMAKKMEAYAEAMAKQSNIRHPEKLGELSERRHFNLSLLEGLGVFYVGEMVEMLLPEFIDDVDKLGVISATNKMPIFKDRYVFPIRDIDGRIINFVGYTWKSDTRYVYGTGKYYERGNDMYGMEAFMYAQDMGWAIVVEGITDKIALNNAGYMNAFAMCGTAKSEEKMWLLSSLENGVIFIHDRDKAGDETRKHWIVPRCVRVNICGNVKDIDEYLNGSDSAAVRTENNYYLSLAISDAVNWLREGKCYANKSQAIVNNITLM